MTDTTKDLATIRMKHSRDDMVDAFRYSIECLKVQRARREKTHRIVMVILLVSAITIGALSTWWFS